MTPPWRRAGAVSWGAGGPPPSEISALPCGPQKVRDKAVTCQNFQKACSALVVILMLLRFVTFNDLHYILTNEFACVYVFII